MTAFIKQEALEKAHEIKIKADEEFEIEKTKLVRQETDAIDATYTKKFKQATMSQQITRSTVANKTRLKVLAARQELLDDIFESAENRLADLSAKDKKKYGETLKNLVLEGFYLLNEPDLVVRARKVDYDLARTAIEKAAKEYKGALSREVKATLDEENPVAEGRYAAPCIQARTYLWLLTNSLITARVESGSSVAQARSKLTTHSKPGYSS